MEQQHHIASHIAGIDRNDGQHFAIRQRKHLVMIDGIQVTRWHRLKDNASTAISMNANRAFAIWGDMHNVRICKQSHYSHYSIWMSVCFGWARWCRSETMVPNACSRACRPSDGSGNSARRTAEWRKKKNPKDISQLVFARTPTDLSIYFRYFGEFIDHHLIIEVFDSHFVADICVCVCVYLMKNISESDF